MFLSSVSSWSFDLSQYDQVWSSVIQLLLILVFLIIGNSLRRVVPFLRKAFIPSALIGGLLLFIFDLILSSFGIKIVDKRLMQIITYHSLAIGFIASSLKMFEDKKKVPFIKSVQNGALTGGTYMLQAAIGIVVSLCFMLVTGDFFYDAGVLLPLGFGQGPGNALTWDINFTNMSSSFKGAGSVGLTIASIGFIVASLVGIIYINIFKRKGEIVPRVASLNRKVSDFEDLNEIEDSDSVDKMTIQIALIAVCYVISFGIMILFKKISDWTGVALFNSVAWGFNFIWGVLAANIVKIILKSLRKHKLMNHRYVNNYQMDRISGFAFDLMILAGVTAIDIEFIKNYIGFLIVLCVVGTIVTIIYVRIMSKRCFKGYEHESFLINFGTLTGTASNGMILLREIDPNYETPMNNIFIVSQLPAMLFVAPLLLLLNMSASSLTKCIIALVIFIVLFIAYTIFLLLSARKEK